MAFGFLKRLVKPVAKLFTRKVAKGVVKEKVIKKGAKVGSGALLKGGSKKGVKTGSRAVALSPQQAVKAPPKKIITVPNRTPAQAAASAKAKKDLLNKLSTNNLRTRTPAGMTTQGAKFFNPNPPPLTGTSYLAQTGQVQPTIPTMAKLGGVALVGAGAVGAGTTAVVMNKKKKKRRN